MKDVQTANPPLRSHRTGPRTQLLHGRTNTSVLPRCTACAAALISLWQDRREEDVVVSDSDPVWRMVQVERSNKDPTEPGLQHKSFYKPVCPDSLSHVLCQLTPPKTPEDIFYFISFYYIWFHLILRRKRSCRQSDLLVVLLVSHGAAEFFTCSTWGVRVLLLFHIENKEK